LWLAVSSATDILIASIMSIGGIAMAPLPAWIVACTLTAAAAFAVVADLVKVPTFRSLGVA
jgi:H+-transporting ATPase